MSSIQKYFDNEKLKQAYNTILDDREKLVEKLDLMNKLIDIVEYYFDTGEMSDLTKIKKLIGDYCD